jgi:alanyl-tRNA synthetase
MTSVNTTRQAFLDFFASKDHLVLPSSSLVPQQDPTLMFSNAGMNQFKNVFVGAETPRHPRAATSQKCVRAGGKHNDLDNVGYTARHHTFFEMLGNFSFGDYFKEQAIAYAWELLTKELGLNPKKMLATVYHTDDEAFALWKKIAGFSDDKIIRIATKDNFWQMGDTGPCGPCSEIFYDHGEQIAGGPPGSPDEDGDRFIEIWNLVFMQFDRQADGADIPLPKPSIDTGMGLERVSAVLQGVHDNYDIDLFKNLIRASEEATRTKAEGEHRASHRVIADHLRSACFLMADGVLPSNEGRGYVLRRIMRRAMRHAHLLGSKQPLMHRLVPALLAEMGKAYPELHRAEALMTENLRLEEERFQVTLERGLGLLEEAIAGIGHQALGGDIAFKLYDTYGFPLDLTQDILRGKGMTVDLDGFNAAMAEQKTRARAAWSGSGDAATKKIWLSLRDQLGATEFLGYSEEKSIGKVVAIVQGEASLTEAPAGAEVAVILNQTPFYGESGGQIGDTGWLLQKGGIVAEVLDVTKPADGLHVHKVKLLAPLKVGEDCELQVDSTRRNQIRANHSATHLLHAALRQILGEHIAQKGSEVAADKLRFDVSHPKALTAEEIAQVEAQVNQLIWQNTATTTRIMPTQAAIEAGATAMFGEKYGDEVRVVSMGNASFSTELCGGTHVARTGDIGLFKITSETAVAAGVRRIEAVTRDGAFAYLAERNKMLANLALEMKIPVTELPERIALLQADKKRLEKELGDAKRKAAMGGSGGNAAFEQITIGDIIFASKALEGIDPKDLRSIATEILAKIGKGVVAVGSNTDGKAALVVAASPDSGADSAALIRLATPLVGGQGGGGRAEMAQGGGTDGSNIHAALAAIATALR